jgi:hypothetical protein
VYERRLTSVLHVKYRRAETFAGWTPFRPPASVRKRTRFTVITKKGMESKRDGTQARRVIRRGNIGEKFRCWRGNGEIFGGGETETEIGGESILPRARDYEAAP